MRLMLASSSPRRRELLETLGYEVVVARPSTDETPQPGESAPALVQRLALAKAQSIQAENSDVVVAADTVVTIDRDLIGKPADRADAQAILERLSGRSHTVVTGYCVRCGDRSEVAAVATTVHFRNCTTAEIASYVATGEADDKAGAYGVQGRGGALVERVDGSYTNVVGLPLTEVLAAVTKLSP
ncbi:MAG: Maf family protein [Planctomycetota bacterium]